MLLLKYKLFDSFLQRLTFTTSSFTTSSFTTSSFTTSLLPTETRSQSIVRLRVPVVKVKRCEKVHKLLFVFCYIINYILIII